MNAVPQPYDFLMLAVLLLSTLFGAWKGMAWQLAALASLIVGVFVATRFGCRLCPYIDLNPPWNHCVAMLLLYLATSLAIWLLFRMVAGVIDRVELKEFDRQAGAVFGAAKGVLWCLVITFFAVILSDARPKILSSWSGRHAALLIHRAVPLLPAEVRELVGRNLKQFQPGPAREDPARQPGATEIGRRESRSPFGLEHGGRRAGRIAKTLVFAAFEAPADRT